MRTGLLLLAAVVTEVSGSLALKAAVDQPAWYALTAVGFVTAIVLMALILRTGMPIGVVYGIWGALGVALTAALSAVVFGETLTPLMVAGLALIVVGVLTVQIGSDARRPREP